MPHGRKFTKIGKQHDNFNCGLCDYSTTSITGLRLHLKMNHQTQLPKKYTKIKNRNSRRSGYNLGWIRTKKKIRGRCKNRERSKKTKKEKQFLVPSQKLQNLEADLTRMGENEKLETRFGGEILPYFESLEDLRRIKRFKKWVKENLVGLSGHAITVAGLVTATVMYARGALTKREKAVKEFSGALSKIAKELGPIAAAIVGILTSTISYGASGIAFLANNLWLIVLTIVMFLMEKYRYHKCDPSRKNAH